MTKILAVVALIFSIATGLNPSMKCALKNQVVLDFKNAVIPIIYQKIHHIEMPDIHTKSHGITVHISKIQVDINPIDVNRINIIFVPNTSRIQTHADGLGMSGGAHIKAQWAFISKTLNAHVKISQLAFDVVIGLISNGGKPNINIDSLQIHLSGNHVQIHFSGGIIEKIMEFIANLLKGYFVAGIVQSLNKSIPPSVTNQVNSLLNTLPSDIDIGNNLAVKYGYPSASHVMNGYLFNGISAYVHQKGRPDPPPFAPPNIPEYNPNDNRGIQFFFSDYIVKSAIHAGFALGLYKISLEKKIDIHSVKMTCQATKMPELSFNNAIDVKVSATCDVVADNKVEEGFQVISELHVNLKEYLKQAILFFNIQTVKIEKIEYKFKKTIDIQWFKNKLNEILDTIKELVNREFGSKGIPLPSVKGVEYSDIIQSVKVGYIEIGVTPKFHLSMEEEEAERQWH